MSHIKASSVTTAAQARRCMLEMIKAHGNNQLAFCHRHGLSVASVNEFLNGKRTTPSPRICRALGFAIGTTPGAVTLALMRAAKARLEGRVKDGNR